MSVRRTEYTPPRSVQALETKSEPMSHPSVLVIYNEPVLPPDHPDAASEFDVLEATQLVMKILTDAGFPTRQVGFSYDPRVLLDELRDRPADVVFNLFEGLADQTATEISAVGLLEWIGVPFTGSTSSAIALGRDKIRTKYLLKGAGLQTANFQVLDRAQAEPWPYKWPAIVKPAYQDCSIGIEQNSVVTNQKELDERVTCILDRYGPPILVEEFIFGREFHENIIEEHKDNSASTDTVALPLAEIRYAYKPGQRYWPIYSYEAKWNTNSVEFQGTPLDSPVFVAPDLWERIRQVSVQAYQLLGLRDYGRVDIRLNEDGRPYVLEVNPNPYIHSEAIHNGLKAIGRTHSQFIVDLVKSALARSKAKT